MNTRLSRTRVPLALAMTITLGLGMLAAGPAVLAAGPTAVDLGTAASFAVLAGTPNISSSGATTVTGDIGIHPAAALSGFPPGTASGTIHLADATALQAKSDLGVAYDDAAGRVAGATHATLGGLTLVAGVYTAGGATLDLTGTLTLDATNDPDAVWVFKATSDLVTASSSVVRIINGGQACNVFWQVTSSATLGSGSTMVGTVMALTSITMASGVTVDGRALARNGIVSMIADSVSVPTCTAPGAGASASASASASAGRSATPTPVGTVGGVVTIPPTDTLGTTAPVRPNSSMLVMFLAILTTVLLLAVVAPMLRARRR